MLNVFLSEQYRGVVEVQFYVWFPWPSPVAYTLETHLYV